MWLCWRVCCRPSPRWLRLAFTVPDRLVVRGPGTRGGAPASKSHTTEPP